MGSEFRREAVYFLFCFQRRKSAGQIRRTELPLPPVDASKRGFRSLRLQSAGPALPVRGAVADRFRYQFPAVKITFAALNKGRQMHFYKELMKRKRGCCSKQSAAASFLSADKRHGTLKNEKITGFRGAQIRLSRFSAWLSSKEKARMIRFSETYAVSG